MVSKIFGLNQSLFLFGLFCDLGIEVRVNENSHRTGQLRIMLGIALIIIVQNQIASSSLSN
jgi:hypothetical protein